MKFSKNSERKLRVTQVAQKMYFFPQNHQLSCVLSKDHAAVASTKRGCSCHRGHLLDPLDQPTSQHRSWTEVFELKNRDHKSGKNCRIFTGQKFQISNQNSSAHKISGAAFKTHYILLCWDVCWSSGSRRCSRWKLVPRFVLTTAAWSLESTHDSRWFWKKSTFFVPLV